MYIISRSEFDRRVSEFYTPYEDDSISVVNKYMYEAQRSVMKNVMYEAQDGLLEYVEDEEVQEPVYVCMVGDVKNTMLLYNIGSRGLLTGRRLFGREATNVGHY